MTKSYRVYYVLFMLFVFLLTFTGVQQDFLYQMMFVSFNSITTDVTTGAGTVYHYGDLSTAASCSE